MDILSIIDWVCALIVIITALYHFFRAATSGAFVSDLGLGILLVLAVMAYISVRLLVLTHYGFTFTGG